MLEASRQLRVGVVGIGARCYLAALADSSPVSARLVAAADTAPDAVERAQRLLPEGVAVVADHRDLLGHGIDAVVLTTPDDTHEELARFFLQAGIPVYLEKPLAITIEAADRILEVARRTGTRLYVGHNMRHMEVVRLLKSIIDSGRIGEVKAIWCRHFVGNGGDYYFRDWHAERRHVTGLLLQKAAHDIDVMSWLAASEPARVVGMGGLMVYGEAERRPAGTSAGTVMQDWFSLDHWPADEVDGLTPDYWRSYTAIGTRGRAENLGDGAGDVVKVWTERTEHYAERATQEYVIAEEGTGHDSADQLAIDEFLRFVRDGGATEVSPVSARDAVAAGVLATRSLRSGSVPFDVPELDAELADYFHRGQHNSH